MPKDPFDANNQGTINFNQPHPTYGNTYTDARPKVKAVATKLSNQGYTVGSSRPGMWTVKGGPKKATKSAAPTASQKRMSELNDQARVDAGRAKRAAAKPPKKKK